MIHHKEVSQRTTAVTPKMKTKMRMSMRMNMSPKVKMEALHYQRFTKSQVMMRRIV